MHDALKIDQRGESYLAYMTALLDPGQQQKRIYMVHGTSGDHTLWLQATANIKGTLIKSNSNGMNRSAICRQMQLLSRRLVCKAR